MTRYLGLGFEIRWMYVVGNHSKAQTKESKKKNEKERRKKKEKETEESRMSWFRGLGGGEDEDEDKDQKEYSRRRTDMGVYVFSSGAFGSTAVIQKDGHEWTVHISRAIRQGRVMATHDLQ